MRLHLRLVLLPLLWMFTSCVTPVPKGGDFAESPIDKDDLAFSIDMDLLSTARLPDSLKAEGQPRLQTFRRLETILTDYIQALDHNLTVTSMNATIRGKRLSGRVSGITAIGVLFASGVVVVPVLGAVAVLAGLGVQHFSIAPVEHDARRRLDEAKQLVDQLPDIERAFDALVFAGSETEAMRRCKRWEAYLVDFESKARHFFSRYAGGR